MNKDLAGPLVLVGFISALLHLGTFSGLDSDMQLHSLGSWLTFRGRVPYREFFDAKPPFYYFMLIPANFVGGRMVHFMAMHLIYVAALNMLLFYAGQRLLKSTGAGLAAWLFYSLSTVVVFYEYGNLNAGIVYAASLLALGCFLILIRGYGKMASGVLSSRLYLAAGVLGGLAFCTRFALAVTGVFAAMCVWLLIRRLQRPAMVLRASALYAAGFALSVLIVLALIRFPMAELYDDIIVFNSHYAANYNTPAYINPQWPKALVLILRAVVTVSTAAVYGAAMVLAFLVAWLLRIRERHAGAGAIPGGLSGQWGAWVAVFMLMEVVMVFLQGTWTKQYPYFAVFVPMSILAAQAYMYIGARLWPKVQRRALMVAALAVLVLGYAGLQAYNARGQMARVLEWPEAELISEVRKYAKQDGDFYTLTLAPYLYLETGIMPPPFVYNHYKYEHWSFVDSRPEAAEERWLELARLRPKVLVLNPEYLVPEMYPLIKSGYKVYKAYHLSYRYMETAVMLVRSDLLPEPGP